MKPIITFLCAMLILIEISCEQQRVPQADKVLPHEALEPGLPAIAPENKGEREPAWESLKALSSLHEFPAIVRANQATAELSVTHASTIRQIHVQVGTQVKKGEPLVDVNSEELLLEAATYLAVQSQLRIHQQRLKELRALQGQKLVARSELFEQQAKIGELTRTRELAAASLRASGLSPQSARLYVQKGYFTLFSPIDGILSDISVHVGQSVVAHSSALARIVGRAQARVEVRTQGEPAQAQDLEFTGHNGIRVALKSPALASIVEPKSGNHLSWYLTQNNEALPDGLTGFVSLRTSHQVFQIPADWVQKNKKILRKRSGIVDTIEVQVLQTENGRASIRGELSPGDEVSAQPSPEPGARKR